jgi:aspartyl protease family protein
MLITRAMLLAIATLSALSAGGGVLALAKPHATAIQPIHRGADGHFWADGTASSDVGRAEVHFLVDTGASTVALTAADAARLGLKPDQLIYSNPVFTAEGEVRAAPVMLSRIDIGGAVVREVRAVVLQDGPRGERPRTSLLGMSYLGRLSRITATRESLLLEP